MQNDFKMITLYKNMSANWLWLFLFKKELLLFVFGKLIIVILRNVFNDIVTDSSLCTMLIILNGHHDATIANCFRFHNSSIISFNSRSRCHMLMIKLIFTLTSNYNFLVNIVFNRKELWYLFETQKVHNNNNNNRIILP